MVRISIVIPCYNHGQYIDDTLDSIAQIKDKDIFEVIIVNDGSTDAYTNEHLQDLSKDYNVIVQKNKGLSGARNTGISHAKGDIILPLDADNRVKPEYLYTAIDILDRYPEVDIVYSDATYFGEQSGTFKSYPFNLQRLMLGNYIDACGIFRKAVWEKTGGYDEQMRNGHEDWEFWLNAAFNGAKFHYVSKELFEYRVLHNSMVRVLNRDKTKVNAIIEYIKDKHTSYFGPQYIDDNFISKFKAQPIGIIGKMLMKAYMPSRFGKLIEKGKLRKYL